MPTNVGWLSARLKSGLLDVRHRIEFALLRTVIALVRMLPLNRAVSLSARAWRRLAPLVARKRHLRARENIRRAFPEQTDAWREAVIAAHWENLGRVMAETMQIDRIIAEPDRIEIPRLLYDRYAGKLGAAIGCTLHMGNWELAVWPFVRAGAHPAAVYRTVKNPYVDAYLRHLRRDLYPGGLLGKGKVDGSMEEGQRTARQIMDFVRHGGRLGLVCDLYDNWGIEVPFFGQPAKSVMIASMIARRLGARIWLARCIRTCEQSRFRVEVRELKVPRGADMSADIKWITAAMQSQFEAWIREHPEQWMWSNRRWS